jgi:membrane protease YdiL (CAAX protease family)
MKLRNELTGEEYLALNPVSTKTLLRWLLILIGFDVGCGVLSYLLGYGGVPESMKEFHRSAGSLPLLWTAVVIAAPAWEELLFRGFMFRGVQASKLGSPGAIIITALAWSALHAQQYALWDLVLVFASGVLLGVARVKSNSTYLTFAMHSFSNWIC